MFFHLTRTVSGKVFTLLPGIPRTRSQYNDNPYEQQNLAPCHTFFLLTALDMAPTERVVCSTTCCCRSARMLGHRYQHIWFQVYTFFLW